MYQPCIGLWIRIQRVSNVYPVYPDVSSRIHLYQACIYTSRSGYIPGYMPDTYLGYISPDTFQIQLQIHMYPMYSVLLVLGYNGYVTIHMWIHVSRYLAPGYNLNTSRIRVSAPWVLVCAKILPKYVVEYLHPPCLPPPSSLAGSRLTRHHCEAL